MKGIFNIAFFKYVMLQLYCLNIILLEDLHLCFYSYDISRVFRCSPIPVQCRYLTSQGLSVLLKVSVSEFGKGMNEWMA